MRNLRPLKVNKSTPFFTKNIGKTMQVFNNNTKENMNGIVLKEKRRHIWVNFGNNNIRRIKKNGNDILSL